MNIIILLNSIFFGIHKFNFGYNTMLAFDIDFIQDIGCSQWFDCIFCIEKEGSLM